MREAADLNAAQARAALQEASVRAGQVHRSDRQLSWLLMVVAGVYLGAGVLVSLSPNGGRSVGGAAVLGLVVVAIAALVVISLRIRVFSRAGIRWYFGVMIAFSLWNSAVVAASILTRFWALGQPAYHFGISAALAAAPLVVSALVIGRRR